VVAACARIGDAREREAALGMRVGNTTARGRHGTYSGAGRGANPLRPVDVQPLPSRSVRLACLREVSVSRMSVMAMGMLQVHL